MAKTNEEKVEHLQRILATINEINRVLVVKRDLNSILKEVCRIFVKTRGYQFCWISLTNSEKKITHSEYRGKQNGLSKAIIEINRGAYFWAYEESLKNKQAIVVKEAHPDCILPIDYEEYTQFLCPLRVDDAISGFIMVVVRNIDANHPKELLTFSDLTNNIGFALSNIRAHEKLLQVFEDSPDGFITFDKNLRILDVNAAFCQIMQMDKSALLSKNAMNLAAKLKDKINSKTILNVAAAIKQGKRINQLEVEIEDKVYAISTNLNEHSRVRVATVRDITLAKTSEIILKQNEEKYRTLVETLSDCVFIMQDGVVKYANQNLYKLFDLTPDDLIDRDFSEFLDPSEIKRVLQFHNNRRSGLPAPENYESIGLSKTGKKIPVNVTVVETEYNDRKAWQVHLNDITNYKKALTDIKESRQKLNTLLDNLPGMAYTCINNKDWEMLFMSEGCYNLVGYSPGELINCKDICFSDLVVEEDRERIWDEIQEALKNKTSFEIEYRILTKNGDEKWVWERGKCVDEKKQILEGFITDISDRKKLEENSNLLSKAVNASPVSVVITNLEGNIEYVNPCFEEKTGYTLDEAIGQKPSILKSGKQDDKFYRTLWQTITKGEIWQGEIHNRTKFGEEYWEQAIISPITDQNGVIQHFVAVKEDITEKKESQKQIRLAQEHVRDQNVKLVNQRNEIQAHNLRLESLLRISQLKTNSKKELLDFALQEAINLTQSKFGYIYFYNEETHQFTLNTWSNEVMGECSVVDPQTVYDLDSTGCWGEAVRQRKPIIINDYEQENEYKRGLPEGHVRLEKFLTIPVFIENEIVAVTGVANKSEDYSRLDVRQLELLMDSVWKILERINLIEELQKAKSKAEESDRLKSAFLANMSHEIRTPMNGILGFTELLQSPQLTGEQRSEFIGIIKKSGDRMLATINDIINISKIESGLETLIEKEVDLIKQCEDMYNFFLPETIAKGLDFTIIRDENIQNSVLKTDVDKLNSILNNLIKNAIKFTKAGGIEFGYKQRNNEIEIFVKDTGIGIPEARQQAIFDRFVQADLTDKRAYEGAGLGLAITKSYTEMLGGTIHLQSKEGVGTTFTVILPLKKQVGQEKILDLIPDDEKIKTTMKKLKVLIAEDDPTSVQLLELLLKDKAGEIFYAENGEEAVEFVRKNPDLDLIMMDIKMPVMDGFEATQIIRTFNSEVLIIAQTAFAQQEDNEKALSVGCNDCLTKPISRKLLNEKIEYYFEKD